jgi:WD40 repeat protein
MFDLLASIPLSPATPSSTISILTPDIFALAIHPKLPIYSIGLSTGHVQTFRLPSVSNTPSYSTTKNPIKGHNAPPNSRTTSHNDTSKEETNGSSQPRRSSLTDTGHSGGAVVLLWKTKRHKGSCRALAFSVDGKYLISAGSEGIVKAASTETGKVVSKIAVPHVR